MIMSAAVLKVIIDFLVNEGRDKPKDGDITSKIIGDNNTFPAFIMIRFIGDMLHSSRFTPEEEGLLTSFQFFREGMKLLSFSKGMKTLELSGLDESAKRSLSDAKDRFKDARREATRAFANEALGTAYRILAMKYRVMATVLEKLDNPEDAVAPCRVCIEELNSMAAVEHAFLIELNKGFMSWFGKDERSRTIVDVCTINVAVRNVFLSLGSVVKLPPILVGNENVDPLRDERVLQILRKLDVKFQGE